MISTVSIPSLFKVISYKIKPAPDQHTFSDKFSIALV